MSGTTLGSKATAEGDSTTASEGAAHAEGYRTTASGYCSHAEGCYTVALGEHSHAEGYSTKATSKAQHTFGEYNIVDSAPAGSMNRGTYVEIVGNGSGSSAPSNARTLDWSGNEQLQGALYVGADTSIATLDESKRVLAASNTAAPFDPTENYVVGTYTIYDGILYRCTTAHTGAWDASHFTAVSVGAELQNKAPAEYGLGGVAQLLNSSNDLDNITQNGWYRWGVNAPAHAPLLDDTNPLVYCTMLVMNGGTYGNNILQIIHSFLYSGRYTIVMRQIGSADWEWTDPPLEADTEYRTTERFNGSVVYTKLLSSVSLSSTGTVNCPHNVSDLARVISISGYVAMGPIACTKGVTISVDATNVVITTDNADVPASPNNKARIAIKYTKSS